MKNRVKEKLRAKEQVFGTFLWSSSSTVVECMGYTGLDYVIIDSEHSPIDTEGAIGMINAAKLKGLTPFVRVKEVSRAAILKMLDGGAEALVIPCLKSVEEVRKVVEYGKYQPVGERGFAQSRQAGYGYEDYARDLQGYFEVSNSQTMLLPMCETATFLKDLEKIVKLEGIDGIFVGPYDLSVALGAPGVLTRTNSGMPCSGSRRSAETMESTHLFFPMDRLWQHSIRQWATRESHWGRMCRC